MLKKDVANFYKDIERLLIAVDCIIFGFEKQRLKILLFKRKVKPFEEKWSLIGTFVKPNENVDHAAKRVLEESTGLKNIYLDELAVYGNVDRNINIRVISVAHYALIRINEHEKKVIEDYEVKWFDIDDIPSLILDHGKMVADALAKLKLKTKNKPIGFELLPKQFTIPQLKALYDGILQKDLDKRNFRKKVLAMGILEKLDIKDKSTSKKGAFLYRFNQKEYEKLKEKGFNFDL